MIARITQLFPLWAVLISVAALWLPEQFAQGRGAIVPLLVVIMFAMGMTLTGADFRRVLAAPGPVLVGVVLQYTVMPLAAFLIARALALPPELTAGMVLVGASAGGTASNVVAYLAGADVALSVTLTVCSTLLAVLATPALTWLYLGQSVPVPVADMLWSVAKMVLLPVLLGAAINTRFGPQLARVRPVLPLVAVSAIVLIIGIVVGLNAGRLAQVGALVFVAVVLHNGAGLAAGYGLSRLLGLDRRTCRTIAIEVGMQNSGLSVALAVKYFGAAAALPGALFSIWHNLSGSMLAAWWSRRGRRGTLVDVRD